MDEFSLPLEDFFTPRRIAVVGASETPADPGYRLLANLHSFPGRVWAIHSTAANILHRPCVPSLADLPERPDLVVIASHSCRVAEDVRAAVAGRARAVVIVSPVRETDCGAVSIESEIRRAIQGSRTRVIGPDSFGILNPFAFLNASNAPAMPLQGKVAFLSQSGALCSAILDSSLREHLGFSAFVSTGSMIDVSWGDLIEHFGDDPHTSCIVLSMETVGDPRKFLSAAREVALKKPIIAIKAGRTEDAARAALTHTGALAGQDDVLEAAFRRAGILRVNTIAEMYYMAEVLGRQPRPKGPSLAILTNAGGPGVIAADSLVLNGGKLARLTPATWDAIGKYLPPQAPRANPVDLLGDATPERYARALEALIQDPNVDGVLAILTPQVSTDATRTAAAIARYAKSAKPLLASWMGGQSVLEGEGMLNQAGIPTFPYPDTAARAFEFMWDYARNLQGLYETPTAIPDSDADAPNPDLAGRLIQAARYANRTLLSEHESKQLLAAYGIPVTPGEVAEDEEQAVEAAERVGYPAAVKLHSRTLAHKSRHGGVRLNLSRAAQVRRAFHEIRAAGTASAGAAHFHGVTVQPMHRGDYELLLGSTVDAQFGPVLMFGAGGTLAEVVRDRAIAFPPLNTTLARRLMERTRIFQALSGQFGRDAVDLAQLEKLLVLFSRLVADHPAIQSIDVNPLLAGPDGYCALDARVALHPHSEAPDERLPALAIRPYPNQYIWRWTDKQGSDWTIRPIRPEDEPAMVAFHQTLSDYTVYMRYFQSMRLDQRTAHERLMRVCFVDYDREMALVAERSDPESGQPVISGVSRLVRHHGRTESEFAVVVSDSYHRRGIGEELMRRLIDVARGEKVPRLTSWILPDNPSMVNLCRKLGFSARYSEEERLVRCEMAL